MAAEIAHREIKSVQVPLKPHQEQVEINILVLLRLDDIGAVLVNKVGHGGHNALLVRTRDQEHGMLWRLWLDCRRRNHFIAPGV